MTPIGLLTWRGGRTLTGPTTLDKELQTTKQYQKKDSLPSWLSNAKWSALKSYTHKSNIQTEQVVFIYLGL